MKLCLVVEGYGEVDAGPVLLRRLFAHCGAWVDVLRPIRIAKGKLVQEQELARVIEFAAKRVGPEDAILVLLDGDESCPAELGTRLLAWAKAARADRRIAVVVAKTEFEAWLIAGAKALVDAGRLGPRAADVPVDPEAIRDAKGWLSQHMEGRYSPTLHQAAFSALIDIAAVRSCRSFDKLVREVEKLAGARSS